MSRQVDPNARTVVSRPVPTPAALPKSVFVLVLSGNSFGELYKLPAGNKVVRVGRGDEADISLDDDGVSRLHCSLTASADSALLKDLGSSNGTFVNGVRVSEQKLRDGDRVQVGGGTIFQVRYADDLEATYQRRLTEIALRDPLTGLYNRRHFHERLEAEFAGARRYGHPLSLLLVDVDSLVDVNTRSGRPAGDEVLKHIALLLQESVRSPDVVARVGGDEFAVLLRETDLAGAQNLAERLRGAVERLRSGADAVSVTVAVAVDVPTADRESGPAPRELLVSAERALDRLKQLGTNRVGT
jgi:two-component system, cell cycle response regulator